VWAYFLVKDSAALLFNTLQYKHLPSVNSFALSSAGILLFASLRSISAGPVYQATFPPGAPACSFGGAGGLGEPEKAVPPPLICAMFSAHLCQI